MKASKSHAMLLLSVLAALLGVAHEANAQTVTTSRCSTGVHEGQASGTVFFPEDQLFCALLSDPKEPRSFVTYLRGDFRTLSDPEGRTTHIGSVGLGDSFGLVRFGGPAAGEGLQLDIVGSVFAQFDLGTPSSDLINADYVVGFPLTFRRSGFSLRAKVYHQSSHLGDEYLLRDEEIQRENLSFESVELLASQEAGPLRAYVGMERLFRRNPAALAGQLVHAGLELRRGRAGPSRLVAGIDVKTTRQHDWSPAISARLGLEVARSAAAGHPGRLVAFLLEVYDGPSPYGQFFQDDITYVGIGFHLGL
jgi:hypothetical protein